MNRNSIKKIQERIIQLLPVGQQSQPGLLLTDSCSEISRLVASWTLELDKSNRILIMKGLNIRGTRRAHDILVVITANGQVYVIDPTIWQFFPQAKSILVSISNNVDVALDEIKKKYGGQWSKSEEFKHLGEEEEKKYLDIIAQNIQENLE